MPSKGFGSSAQAEDTNSVSVMTTDKSNANTFRMVLFLLYNFADVITYPQSGLIVQCRKRLIKKQYIRI